MLALVAAVVAALLALLANQQIAQLDTMLAPLRIVGARASSRMAPSWASGIVTTAARYKKDLTSSSLSAFQSSLLPTIYSTSTRHNSTMTSAYDKLSLKKAAEERRSIYQLDKSSPIPDSRLQEIVKAATETVPSSFNSQSTRLVVLVKEEHDKFWGIVEDALKAIVPEDKWEHTAQRLSWFSGSYGTVSPLHQ